MTGRISYTGTMHPAVVVALFVTVIAVTMAFMQPALVALSFAGALITSLLYRGWRASVSTLVWCLPIVALAALFNPLFANVGSTELASLGRFVIHLESVAYGATMGLMLAAMLLWFANLSAAISFEEMLSLTGRRFATVSMTAAMAMRLIPNLTGRAKLIAATADATTAAAPCSVAERTQRRLRQVTVLMGWSMEDSLETADAMRARGWSADRRRTTFRRYSPGRLDVVVGATLAVLAVVATLSAWRLGASYRFYPTLDPLIWSWGYVPFALLMATPSLLRAGSIRQLRSMSEML